MLAGAAFDLLVTLTDMQEHEHLNRQALEAGKHVWSEKPIANTLAAGRELLELSKKKSVRLWGAPITVASPQFAFMAKTLAAGKLGRVAAAHADYGHTGPGWSSSMMCCIRFQVTKRSPASCQSRQAALPSSYRS